MSGFEFSRNIEACSVEEGYKKFIKEIEMSYGKNQANCCSRPIMNGDSYDYYSVNCKLVRTVKKVKVKVTKETVHHGKATSVYVAYDEYTDKPIFRRPYEDKLALVDDTMTYCKNHCTNAYIRRIVKYSNGENDDLYRIKAVMNPSKTGQAIYEYDFSVYLMDV